MGLREEKKQRQRQEIIDAALALFRKKGFDETRVRDITSKLRISEATFFNYFPSKEAVLQEFSAATQDGYDRVLEHLVEEKQRPVADRLRELMSVLAFAFSEDRAFMVTAVTKSNFFFAPEPHPMHQRYSRHRDLISEILREGQEKGELRRDLEAGQLTEVLTGIYVLSIMNWLGEDQASWHYSTRGGELEPRLQRALSVFLEGCLPTSGHTPAGRTSARSRRSKKRLTS
jgi:AcrR family transcriptional regulator